MLIYLDICVPCFAQKKKKRKEKDLCVLCEDSHVDNFLVSVKA